MASKLFLTLKYISLLTGMERDGVIFQESTSMSTLLRVTPLRFTITSIAVRYLLEKESNS